MAGQEATKRPAALLLAVIVVLGVYAFSQSRYFSISKIEVKGNRYYSRAAVTAAAGLKEGDNIFSVNTVRAQSRLARLPFVGQARVSRLLPNGIRLEITEVEPVAMVLVGEEFWGVSGKGVLLGPLPEGYPPLPVVTGVDPAAVRTSRHSGSLVVAVRILEMLSPELRACLSEICLRDRSNITLITSDAVRVYIGDEGELEKKLLVLEAVLTDLKGKGTSISRIDLRQYDNPVLR